MHQFPDSVKYAATHEWAKSEDDGTITVGISDFAQSELGDLVFVELPEVGRAVIAGEECCVVESVKAASDVYSPVSGEVCAVNESLADAPERVNESPFDEGWLFKLQPSDPGEMEDLLDAETYQEQTESE
ncbi:MAG TPA: glycine cleavage system protein GcvH [Gammaproteobacteria bacterium]|nr:glycine cleavage system protein GcvH [Gammaproteobacteria bacterium]